MSSSRQSVDADEVIGRRGLPSVESLASRIGGPHHLAVAAARVEIELARRKLGASDSAHVDGEQLRTAATSLAGSLAAGSLRSVINATGIVLHTSLGRAPLAPEAAGAAAALATGYSNLELDVEDGGRGSRHDHVATLLKELTGAEAAIAVNNNAAAVLLALAAVAGEGEVVIGRDQLIEIGGSFRVPEILAQSGAKLVEVGTTNRVRIEDYGAAIGARTTALLRVHQSNFRTVGFANSPSLTELCALGRSRGVAVIDDLGSGAVDPMGDEPLVQESVRSGSDAVCFSADKLLGGPQAGIVVGAPDAVELCRHHPLARPLRLDKLQLAALEATLRLRRDHGPDALPALRMLAAPEVELRRRAEGMAHLIGDGAEVLRSSGRAGGGTLPTLELPGPVCAVSTQSRPPGAVVARLRENEPPVIARINRQRVLLDPRTMDDAEAWQAARAVVRALGRA